MDYLSLSAAECFTAATPEWVHDYNTALALQSNSSVPPASLYSFFPLKSVSINEPLKRCKQNWQAVTHTQLLCMLTWYWISVSSKQFKDNFDPKFSKQSSITTKSLKEEFTWHSLSASVCSTCCCNYYYELSRDKYVLVMNIIHIYVYIYMHIHKYIRKHILNTWNTWSVNGLFLFLLPTKKETYF